MILDASGKPVRRPSGFASVDWVAHEWLRLMKDDLAAYRGLDEAWRLADLRESVAQERQSRPKPEAP